MLNILTLWDAMVKGTCFWSDLPLSHEAYDGARVSTNG